MFVFQKDNSINSCADTVSPYEPVLEGYSHDFFSNSLTAAVIGRKALDWNFRKIPILYQTWVMLYGPV